MYLKMSLLVHIKIDHKGNTTVENSVARGNSHQNLTFLTELLDISFLKKTHSLLTLHSNFILSILGVFILFLFLFCLGTG